MRTLLLAACLAAPLRAEEAPMIKLEDASFEPPADWSVKAATAAADPSYSLKSGLSVIRVRLLGGKGSRYASPADFLDGFEARTQGRPPEKAGTASAAGGKVRLYRRGYSLDWSDPHESSPEPPRLAAEEFCLIPAGKKFFVLSYAYESAAPEPSGAGKAAWKAFLKSFRLAKSH